MSGELYLLFESASGFVLTHVKEWEEVGQQAASVVEDVSRFREAVEFKAFHPFTNAQEALENMQAVTRGEATELLVNFLEQNLPKKKKAVGKWSIAVSDPALGKNLSEMGFPAVYNQNALELLRGCRFHLQKLVKQLNDLDLDKFQVGLGHSYSRSKIQFDPNREDKPIMQSIALVDSLDKNINTFAMRVREWYCWHFPELGKIVTDNQSFCEVAKLIRVKEQFGDDRMDELVEACKEDETLAEEIMTAKKISMGQEITEFDMANIDRFAEQVIKLTNLRAKLGNYLGGKLDTVAPNLKTLVGDTLAARLISHAGSLVNLAKYPASTIQILGAEKALFRALKTKGNTPKYGLLFQSSFIGRAAQKNKGRISRYLANKCSLAARIDNFNHLTSGVFGEKMKEQVEDRLKYLTEGSVPKKNLDVMKDAVLQYETLVNQEMKKKKKADKKKKKNIAANEEPLTQEQEEPNEEPEKKKKKRKDTTEEEEQVVVKVTKKNKKQKVAA